MNEIAQKGVPECENKGLQKRPDIHFKNSGQAKQYVAGKYSLGRTAERAVFPKRTGNAEINR